MPESGGGDGGREYGWLYGGKDNGPPDAGRARETPGRTHDDPEPTRVMPTVSRDPGQGTRVPRSGSSSSAPPASRSVPPAQPVAPPRGRSGGRGGRGGRRRVLRVILLVLIVWIVFLVAVPIWAWSKIDKVDASPSGHRPDDQPGTTYLLVGSDSRKGLTPSERKKLSAGGVTESGQRTDTIMLLHTGSGPNVLLSIPRDSLVPIPGHGTTKINAAFSYGGPRLLVRTIEQNTGVKVDHYVEIGFGGFVNAVDAVGGVQICPKKRLDDRRSGLHVKKGCQNVDGITALAFSRDRHSFAALGDVQRAANQRQVVAAIGHKVKSPWTFVNPVRYYHLNKAATTSIRIGKDMGPVALARFAMAMSAGGRNCTVPISDLAVHWDHDRALQLFKRIKDDSTDNLPKSLCTQSGLKP